MANDNVSEIINEISPYYNEKKKPSQQYKIVYESSSETLEPIYFWILDFINDLFPSVEKLVDNFTSSPGSGHFSELMGKASQMQDRAMKILGQVNQIIKSILNVIYDLKEFEMRLEHYDDANSKKEETKEAGLLALKQIWMDNVDMKKGRGSINSMAQQLSFVTLRDAFMACSSVEKAKDMDLNDRVKRILMARLEEFFGWKERSEKELRKRYQIEKRYLKSQADSLKLYTRWAKPYLKAATQLEQKDVGREPSTVTAFNTILLQLTLLGKNDLDTGQAVIDEDLPKGFEKMKKLRKYYSCVLVDFRFRGIPQKAGQHYVFGGRAEVTFKAYSLSEEELKLLDKKLEESDINDALKLVEGLTDESLDEIRKDLEKYLGEEGAYTGEKKPEKEEKKEDVNPFAALLGLHKKENKEEVEEEIKEVKKDRWQEKKVREAAENKAKARCYTVYDIYKKAHGMESLP